MEKGEKTNFEQLMSLVGTKQGNERSIYRFIFGEQYHQTYDMVGALSDACKKLEENGMLELVPAPVYDPFLAADYAFQGPLPNPETTNIWSKLW